MMSTCTTLTLPTHESLDSRPSTLDPRVAPEPWNVSNVSRVRIVGYSRSLRGSQSTHSIATIVTFKVIKEQEMSKGWRKADVWSFGCTVVGAFTSQILDILC